MTFTPISLSRLKTIKNTVIGNPNAKLQLAQDERFVQTLVHCLNDPPPADPADEDLRVEAAHVLASISYGSEPVLATLLRCDAPRAFLYAISKLTPADPAPLRAALARGLRALAIALADTVGPSQWGLRDERAAIRGDAEAALEAVFQIESLDLYLPLLADPLPQTRISIAQLLAFGIRSAAHRAGVAAWAPPAERLREVKTTRGWEKSAATSATGWVCRSLVALMRSRDTKVQEAALWALASLAKDNAPVASVLAKPAERDGPAPLALVLTLAKSRATDTQLAACLCATNVLRALPPAHPPAPLIDDAAARTVMNVLTRVVAALGEPSAARARACFVLYHLVTDHAALAFAAFERGCLGALAGVLRGLTPTEAGAGAGAEEEGEGEDESEGGAVLREAALTALAALALFDNTVRRAVADEQRLLPAILAALGARQVGVRYAACQCVRALSRGVAVLRVNIVDSGLGMKVFGIFKRGSGGSRAGGGGKDGKDGEGAPGPDKRGEGQEGQDGQEQGEDRRVTAAALAAVCNIVNEFSPLRPIYLDLGLMARLVQLLGGGDATLRLSALWAVKNLLSKSSGETKRDVMQTLGWGRLGELLQDADPAIQEQALHLVRNLAENEPGVEMVFREMGAAPLLARLTAALGAADEDVVLQATYVLANLANGAAHTLLPARALLEALRRVLAEGAPCVRRPAVSACLELARAGPAGRRALGEAGVGGTLRGICAAYVAAGGAHSGSPSAYDDRDVIEQARTALDWLEHGEAYG
ncbi:armadillo-type protein [Mycena rosella]|uniref:Armadillo-type protein n=1 Tax=Mycena rosella TaxID=1033263 RepID=A0AAD7CV44_MYCRO|nr:armadillo-type protein [Mycena rosella]